MSLFGMQTQAKRSYETSNIVLHKPLGSLSGNKQDTNKLTKLSTNQQYKIPQPLKKMVLKQPQTNWLDTLQTEENQISSVIQSPTFSKQSISEANLEQHTFATSQQSINTIASQRTFPSYEHISSPHSQEQTLTTYEQAYNNFNQQSAQEMFEIWDKLK